MYCLSDLSPQACEPSYFPHQPRAAHFTNISTKNIAAKMNSMDLNLSGFFGSSKHMTRQFAAIASRIMLSNHKLCTTSFRMILEVRQIGFSPVARNEKNDLDCGSSGVRSCSLSSIAAHSSVSGSSNSIGKSSFSELWAAAAAVRPTFPI